MIVLRILATLTNMYNMQHMTRILLRTACNLAYETKTFENDLIKLHNTGWIILNGFAITLTPSGLQAAKGFSTTFTFRDQCQGIHRELVDHLITGTVL